MTNERDLPRRWMSPGSHDLWGRGDRYATYSAVPYELLPPLSRPAASAADPFAWLRAAPARKPREQLKFGLDGESDLPRPVPQMVDEIVEVAKREGLVVPASYVAFMTHPTLHERVPTCTACYLDIPTKLVALPRGGNGDGRLLRFLNDQQCALLWYLHLTKDGGCSVVVAQPEQDDASDGETLDDVMKPSEVATCAPTFDDFVHRFWMENTLWFSLYEKTKAPLTPEQEAYVAAVRATRAGN